MYTRGLFERNLRPTRTRPSDVAYTLRDGTKLAAGVAFFALTSRRLRPPRGSSSAVACAPWRPTVPKGSYAAGRRMRAAAAVPKARSGCYVNGVEQTEGSRLRGRPGGEIVFARPLVKETVDPRALDGDVPAACSAPTASNETVDVEYRCGGKVELVVATSAIVPDD